jgi:uncharacterized protein with PQ loop repeat
MLPQAVKVIREGNAMGTSTTTVLMWLLGELCALTYVVSKPEIDWPILANFGLNTGLAMILTVYKVSDFRRANILH